jgi:hypothetical protein
MAEIENTSKTWSPEVAIASALATGSMDSYITGMESAGQCQLVASEQLPTDTDGTDDEFVKLGFVFGEPNPSDPMFRPATLPEGWRKEGSDHAMWSYVVDEHGRRRVGVFYKAAFYDRSANMRLRHLSAYARDLAWDGAMPVYGGDWCTRESFAEQVAALRARLVKDLAEAKTYASDLDSDYWPGRVAELEKQLAKHDAWAAKVAADG